MNEILSWVRSHKGKIIAAAVIAIPSFFSFLEATGWGFLSKVQHDAIIKFLESILPVIQ